MGGGNRMTGTRVNGMTGVDRPGAALLEPADGGASLLLCVPPAGLKLDWRGVEELISALVAYRALLPGARHER